MSFKDKVDELRNQAQTTQAANKIIDQLLTDRFVRRELVVDDDGAAKTILKKSYNFV